MHITSNSKTPEKKKVAIMQPYLFPYLGYFQLIAASDFFIFLDDVQYIKRGWINKNKINTKSGETFFTIPIKKSSLEKKINEIVCLDLMTWRDKFFKTLELNYSPKKHDFDFLYFLKEKFIPSEIIDPKISDISIHSIELTLEYLDIDFNYKKSSAYHQSFDKKGTERIISLVKENQGTQYINLPGGKEIYTHSFFATNNLELNFIDITPTAKNINGEFQHSSIIDTIMLLGKKQAKELILNYKLSET